MLNNTNNNSSCAFNEQIVECLYGEINPKEKLKLEAHIKNCFSCADEFAAFGFVRNSVIEWREEDFAKLDTAHFNFPVESFQTIATEKQSGSWVTEFKKLFVFQPLMAMAALAIVIVCAGIIFYSLKPVEVEHVAEIKRNETHQTEITSANEKVILPSDVKETVNQLEQPSKRQISDIDRESRISLNKPIVKVSNRGNESLTPVRENKVIKIREKKNPALKPQVPNLTVADEIEDKSIRLADLFEEIGTE